MTINIKNTTKSSSTQPIKGNCDTCMWKEVMSNKCNGCDGMPATCPKCGCSWDVLEVLCTSDSRENRQTAWVITENCGLCKNEMKQRLADPSVTLAKTTVKKTCKYSEIPISCDKTDCNGCGVYQDFQHKQIDVFAKQFMGKK